MKQSLKVLKNIFVSRATVLFLAMTWLVLNGIFSVTVFADSQTVHSRVLIFYSSTGMGHLSAAKAIEKDIKDKDPNAVVELKDIRDFKNPLSEKISTKLFWFIVKNFPDFYTQKYNEYMNRGLQTPTLSDIKESYKNDELIKYIQDFGPTAVFSTHHGAAQAISSERANGHLRTTKMGWLHTDYFEGYLPRLSKQLDKTFLAHPELGEIWKDQGVPEDKIEISGMPVLSKFITPGEDRRAFRESFLRSKGLNPQITTVTISGGGEGVGDYEKIVRGLAGVGSEPMQIVAVCAKNEKNYNNLESLRSRLSQNVDLINLKFIPQEDLLGFVKSSDLYITKSGGLSPSEGFAVNVPMILLDIYGGHEKENAIFFEKLGLAVINRDYAALTSQARQVLGDEDLRDKMSQAQKTFENSIKIRKITDFLLDPANSPRPVELDLGIEGGTTVTGATEALTQLEKDAPADVEILVSYGKFPKTLDTPLLTPLGKFNMINELLAMVPKSGLLDKEGNPFGHIAIRIGNVVYTINGKAKEGTEENIVRASSLQDYLYSVTRVNQNEEFTDTFGEAYGRDLVSFRIKGISPEQLQAMRNAVEEVDEGWKTGTVRWNKLRFNCADFVISILRAGGFEPKGIVQNPTFPLDVFDSYVDLFEQDSRLRTEIVSYSRIADSKNIFQISTFPVSLRQIPRALKNMVFKGLDPIEEQTTKRIASYPGTREIYYENLNKLSVAEMEGRQEQLAKQFTVRIGQLNLMEQELENLKDQQRSSDLLIGEVHKKLVEAATFLTPSDVEALANGRSASQIAQGNELKAARIKSFQLEFHRWLELEKQKQSLYDEATSEELHLLAEGMYWYMRTVRDDLKLRLDQASFAKFNQGFSNIDYYYGIYRKNIDQYGKPRDGLLRTMPYRMFFSASRNFLQKLNELNGNTLMPVQKLTAKFDKIRSLLKVTSSVFGGVFKAFASKLGLTSEPITPMAGMSLGAVQAGKKLGIQVEIEGRENIPDISKEPKTVNLFVPTHRDPFLDFIIMGNLFPEIAPDGDMLLFAAPDQFLPRKLANLTEKISSFIVVGRGSGQPVNKTLTQLNNGGPRSIFIYPEGSANAGIGELRPLRDKFATDLIPKLQNAGYKVNIIPITYLNSARMPYEARVSSIFGDLTEFKNQKVQIHKPLNSQTVEMLQKLGGDIAVNLFIRSQWLEALDKTEGATSRKTLSEAQERIQSDFHIGSLFLGADCRQLLEGLSKEKVIVGKFH